jgi:hypothetical protein
VSEELARTIRGSIASGRDVAVLFSFRARRVVEVRVQNVFPNDQAVRSFEPSPAARS